MGPRPFRRLLVADAVSSFGDWLTYVGISVLAIGQGQYGLALAVVLIAHTLPRVLCAPLAGALADRIDRRTLLVVASVLRGAAALAMVAAVLAGALWTVQALHLARMALGAFTDAASRAALPRLVGAFATTQPEDGSPDRRESGSLYGGRRFAPPGQLARANAILGISWSVMFVLGIAVGGIVTAAWGVAIAFAADAATFFIAALAFARLPAIPPEQLPRVSARATLSAAVRRAALAKVPVSIATGAGWIVLGLAAGPVGTAFAIGTVHIARATGNGLASLVWPQRWRASAAGVHASTAIGLAGVAMFCATGSVVWAVVWGVGVGANWMTAATVLQTTAPDGVLGRAVALDVAAQALAQCLGGVLVVLVAAFAGLAIAAAAGVGLAAIAWFALAAPSRADASPYAAIADAA